MRKLVIPVLAILLPSCATTHMDKGLDKLLGKPYEEAFDVLGYPSNKNEYGSETVYTWSATRQGAVVVPQTSTTTGYVGNTAVYGQTTTTSVVPTTGSCTVNLVSGPDGILKKWGYRGNTQGCQPFINRLYDYYKPEGSPVNQPPY